ncbi:hypothetical protein GCM10010430_43990 [Kitasatospora cystarginea]|uniref:PPC domain-containing protein n=1 Tax=Kitasatospora cystarginea TaxID=58350 RepID=A0ABN3EEB6_9ACTN
MRHTEITPGRHFALAFDDGDDFFSTLRQFCADHQVRQGFIPMFLGGFRRVQLVGACGPLTDPEAPVWEQVELSTVEAFGAGTIAQHPDTGAFDPHVHLAVGLKAHRAVGHVSHLLGGEVQFIHEMLLIEVIGPQMLRPRLGPHSVPTLTFGD